MALHREIHSAKILVVCLMLAHGTTLFGLEPGWEDGGTTVRLTTSTDRVGIGTASPDKKLDVVFADDTPNAGVNFQNTDGLISFSNATSGINQLAPMIVFSGAGRRG